MRHSIHFRSIGPWFVLAVFVAALAGAAAAHAYPAFGQNADGNCYFCHSTIVDDRSELFNFDGLIDPVEAPGIPDEGELPYFTVEVGSAVDLYYRAVNGEEDYAFEIKGFDQPDVTNEGTLVYSRDTRWRRWQSSFSPIYFTASDGDYDGFDWGTSDPTEVYYRLTVDAATDPGYYLLTYALVGRDPSRDGWYQEHRFYVEVTGGSGGITLTADGTCPGGGPIEVSWSGATPNGQVALLFALSQGSFVIPPGNPCAGTQLGLSGNQLQVGFQGSAGADGSRTVDSNAGAGACGGFLQLLDISTCGLSNVVQIQ